jgi:hypothetical protein
VFRGNVIPRETQKQLKKPVQPDYSMWIASEGQTSTQVWQSTHMSLSIFALSFSMAIADAGHSLTQVSHPVHLSLSTTATNSFTPVNMFLLLGKKGYYHDAFTRENFTVRAGGFLSKTPVCPEVMCEKTRGFQNANSCPREIRQNNDRGYQTTTAGEIVEECRRTEMKRGGSDLVPKIHPTL